MSLFDFNRSGELAHQPFIALVMAALRKADTDNYARLARAFPEIEQELQTRYNSPGGLTPAEQDLEDFEAPRRTP